MSQEDKEVRFSNHNLNDKMVDGAQDETKVDDKGAEEKKKPPELTPAVSGLDAVAAKARKFQLRNSDSDTSSSSSPPLSAGEDDGYTEDEDVESFYEDTGKRRGSTRHFDSGSTYNFLGHMTSRMNKNFINWQWYLRNKRTGGDPETFEPGRLLDRDSPFYQSTGRMQVSHIAGGEARSQVLALYNDDWFHVLLGYPTYKLVFFLAIMVTVQYCVFAGLYLAVNTGSAQCALAAENQDFGFQAAFGFSVITASTIGFGFPGSGDMFFYTCPPFVVVVYIQAIVSLIMNAFVVGVILQRVGRADTRSHQVIFSDKACIRCIGSHFYFSFQVYDLDRRHPVVEAHIRCYAIFHETDGKSTALFQTRFMRIQNPNDELGGVLFLSTPCTVIHCVDQWSPLIPPEESRTFWEKTNDNFVHNSSNRYVFPGLILREVDAECGSRDGASCPVCGESFETDQHLLRHIRYLQREEQLDEDSVETMTQNNTRLNSINPKIVPTTRSANDIVLDEDKNSEKEIGGKNNKLRSQLFRRKRSNSQSGGRPHHTRGLTRSKTSDFIDEMDNNSESSVKQNKGRVYLPRKKEKVHKLLQSYADLNTPIGHKDIDIGLLQTEFSLVQGREDEPATLKELFAPLESESKKPRKTRKVEDMRDSIRRHVEQSKIEIIVLVEGIEARSSNTFQARHSYTYDNINFDKFFAPCMEVSPQGHAQVNLNHFHATIPVPTYVEEPAPVQSHS